MISAMAVARSYLSQIKTAGVLMDYTETSVPATNNSELIKGLVNQIKAAIKPDHVEKTKLDTPITKKESYRVDILLKDPAKKETPSGYTSAPPWRISLLDISGYNPTILLYKGRGNIYKGPASTASVAQVLNVLEPDYKVRP